MMRQTPNMLDWHFSEMDAITVFTHMNFLGEGHGVVGRLDFTGFMHLLVPVSQRKFPGDGGLHALWRLLLEAVLLLPWVLQRSPKFNFEQLIKVPLTPPTPPSRERTESLPVD
jgi:hypothetical protein